MNTKKIILNTLKAGRGEPVSGEALAESIGVSRAAVHKAIKALRSEGYQINASTNKGYRLEEKEQILTPDGLRNNLPDDLPMIFMQSTDSTNTEAKKLALEGAAHGTSVFALRQTAGKGRLGRSFHSTAGTGIYMSIILKPKFDISKSVLITTAASVAVCRALREVCNAEPEIKWVNDVYINNKKVCGILTEATTDFESGQIESLIVGIGINCSTEGFPQDLLEIAGAVKGDYSTDRLAAQVIIELLMLAEDLDSRSFIEEYRQLSMVIGKTVKVYKGGCSPDAGGHSARVLDIDDNGGLHVLYSTGQQETLSSGEISIRL